MNNKETEKTDVAKSFAVRHMRFGWWSLLCFMSIGILLEALHGFKIDWYLNQNFETRRLMWTLGHAHGTLFSIIHIAFAATLYSISVQSKLLNIASAGLIAGGLLLPLGFFLGGIFLYGGDPGFGVFLAPVGAFCMLFAIFFIAIIVSTSTKEFEEVESIVEPEKVQTHSKKKRQKNR